MLIFTMFGTCVYATDDNTDNDNGLEQEQTINLVAPTIKSLEASGTAVTISFGIVDNATKYIVIYSDGKVEKQKQTLGSSLTILNLNYETRYTFKVQAIHESNGEVLASATSASKAVTTGAVTLGKPKLILAAYNKGAILSWNKVSYATGYEIWRYYNKTWTKIKTVGAGTLEYKNTGLSLNKKYYYKVRAIRVANGKTITGAFSESKSITAKTYLTGSTIRMGYDKGVVKWPSKKYKKGSTTQTVSKTKLKVGTKVTIVDRKKVGKHHMVYVKVSSGAKYWIKRCNVRYSAPYTTKDYTTAVKEDFVNKKGYSSKTKYLLFISHYTQRVYLFKGSKGKWDLQKTYRCATGKSYTRTPVGTYKIYKKSKRTLAGSKYATYFCLTNAFHARPAGSKTMGKPASNGCIRMYNKDAIYIYKNMPKGTTVVSY